MNPFAIASLFLAFFLFQPSVAADGPRGGPAFDSYQWTEIRETAPVICDFINPCTPSDPWHWEPRAGLQAVELHNRLYVIGGRTPKETFIPFDSVIHGDVWMSDDLGETWTEILQDAEAEGLWRRRAYFEAVTHGGQMYVLGGQNFSLVPNDCSFWPPDAPFPCPEFISVSEFFNDVWRSKNGMDWEEMTAEAAWSGRAGLGAASFKGKLWVMAGSQNDDADINGQNRIFFNDVWYSDDGSEWHLATENAPWVPRAGGVVLSKGGYLYILGGEKGFTNPNDYFNDVWRSKNGADWELVTASAPWSPRPGHKCSVVADHFVCMGGFGFPFNPSDVWVSKDGADWSLVNVMPWDNDPDPFCGNSPPLRCDNVRYDFDMLTVSGAGKGQKPAVFTFGGDRERFILDPVSNFFRVDNDVWKFAPAD
jgi:hypothetical protein